jgi:hypothetical protein
MTPEQEARLVELIAHHQSRSLHRRLRLLLGQLLFRWAFQNVDMP